MLRPLSRELAAEFLGTLVLITFGVASVAQSVLSREAAGGFLSINLAWGLAVACGVYVAGGVTGAHLNPAVTVALAVHRGFPWHKVIPYALTQTLAAFCGSAIVYLVYCDALDAFDLGQRAIGGELGTAGIWATYPQEFLRPFPIGFLDQVVSTGLLAIGLFALADNRNLTPQSNLGPLVVGALVVLIGMSFGFNCGYAINPARDFGPRLFTAVAGWGLEVFRAHGHWWWIPIVGPILGAVLGGWLYDRFVGAQHPRSGA